MSAKFKIDDKLLSELTSKVKTEADLNELSRQLLKLTIEKALNTELDEHLGYDKHAIDGNNTGIIFAFIILFNLPA